MSTATSATPPPANLDEEHHHQLIDKLDKILADNVVYWMKLQNVHWNLTGPLFYPVHVLTEEHYGAVFTAIDDIAERIRALDGRATGTIATHLEHSQLRERPDLSDAEGLLRDLLVATKHVSRQSRELQETAQELGDEGTADLMIQRIKAEDKFAWMLRALLD